MTTNAALTLLVAVAVAGSVTIPCSAAPSAAMGGHDIGALMDAATAHYDLSDLDAVLLLDDESITVGDDGSLTTTRHTVVWFSTEIGLSAYADVRVPHDTATSTLEVHALRTWRDGRWWPDESELSPTAIVATTPYALQSADDYTTMRETVLLHDGVELPCIVETAYTVTERKGSLPGVDGMWVTRKTDPAVLTRLAVTAPEGVDLSYSLMNGAPEPAVERRPDGGRTWAWEARTAERLPRPLTSENRTCAPHVVWSTWGSWDSLGDAVVSSMGAAAVLTDALRDSVGSVTEGLSLPLARAEAVAEFVRESTRSVSYDGSFWRFSPREAGRTWETAYGHAFDLAVLASALLEEAGVEAVPEYVTPGRSGVDLTVPALCWFDDVTLSVRGEGLSASFDPATGTLTHGVPPEGHTVWHAARDQVPGVVSVEPVRASSYDLRLSLLPSEGGAWTGRGFLSTSGRLSAYGRMVGIEGEVGGFLSGVAGSVLGGASAERPGIAELTEERAAASFDLGLEAPETDELGRTPIVVGDPRGGLLSVLPSDVHLYSEVRQSPVLLGGPMEQTVELRLDPGEMDQVRIPEPFELSNELGSFRLNVERGGDGTLTITRSLRVGPPGEEAVVPPGGAADEASDESGCAHNGLVIAPSRWPELRALLLEESDLRHRTILLK